ncbi:MAG: sulfatase [Candidatus Hodarchaeota archaeon]
MNILFIMSDQHRADHMGCAGNSDIKTPNLDKLASEGTRFRSAYCANPMCMPNRSSILTGMYPNVHGCRSNGINLPEDVESFVETLRKKKYKTHAIGKMHLNYYIRAPKKKNQSWEDIKKWMLEETAADVKANFPSPYYGFEEVLLANGHADICAGHYMDDWLVHRLPGAKEMTLKKFQNFFNLLSYEADLPVELYPSTFIQEKSIDFLEKNSNGDKPFFLFCSFPDPHHPVAPPGEYKTMYKPGEINIPATANSIGDLKDHEYLGPWIESPLFKGALVRVSHEEEIRKFLSLTYGAISLMDHAIGQILGKLEELGLAENTIVVYTSDHGDLGGDHSMIYKGPTPFDGVLRVPLIIKVPGFKPGVTDSLASSIDISRTLLKLVGVRDGRHSPEMQGLDLTPILEDASNKVRDHCFIEEDEEVGIMNVRLRHLVTETHKLTTYVSKEDFGDIYDRISDPDETRNLWNEDKELRLKLIQKMHNVNTDAIRRLPKRASPS